MDVEKSVGSNRMVLLLIAGIPVTVILVATWLWYYVVNGELDLVAALGTSNSGSLVQPPRQLEEVSLADEAALPLKYSELERRWRFLIPGGKNCDQVCESSLYTTRQIHIAMGKEFNRIRRIYLSDTPAADTMMNIDYLSDLQPAPESFTEFLASQHRGMKVMTLSSTDHQTLLREYAIEPSSWYLVDPNGWIMMTYDHTVDYKGVMSDLKFLLKNSSE
ncbi:MAG: SCO family protein [Halioglobus sp.]